MINKRLLGLVPGSMKYIKQNVLVKWLSLVFNILLVFAVSEYLQQLFAGQAGMKETLIAAGVILAAMIVRGAATKGFCTPEFSGVEGSEEDASSADL